MPPDFILSYTSFDNANQPFVDCQVGDQLLRQHLTNETLSLEFDLGQKFCTGWIDFEKHQAQVCPDKALVDDKYENCLACRNKTGFNPAFYHADTVSRQQQKINQQPHFVYLAYFGPNVVKVGISQQQRGIRRLLEQGARLAMRLETFSSALIAREYEAKIAKLDGFLETVSLSRKLELIKQPLDLDLAKARLKSSLENIESALNLSFVEAQIIETDKYFYINSAPDLNKAVNMSHQPLLVGKIQALIGPLLVTEYQGRAVIYNLKRFIGYRAQSKPGLELKLPEEQLALF